MILCTQQKERMNGKLTVTTLQKTSEQRREKILLNGMTWNTFSIIIVIAPFPWKLMFVFKRDIAKLRAAIFIVDNFRRMYHSHRLWFTVLLWLCCWLRFIWATETLMTKFHSEAEMKTQLLIIFSSACRTKVEIDSKSFVCRGSLHCDDLCSEELQRCELKNILRRKLNELWRVYFVINFHFYVRVLAFLKAFTSLLSSFDKSYHKPLKRSNLLSEAQGKFRNIFIQIFHSQKGFVKLHYHTFSFETLLNCGNYHCWVMDASSNYTAFSLASALSPVFTVNFNLMQNDFRALIAACRIFCVR